LAPSHHTGNEEPRPELAKQEATTHTKEEKVNFGHQENSHSQTTKEQYEKMAYIWSMNEQKDQTTESG
jgi:hypothetical protein